MNNTLSENKEAMSLVIIRNPEEPPYPWFIPDDEISVLQEIVGGLFQVMPGNPIGLPANVDLWCNEEGKISGMKMNINIDFDVIVGPAVFRAANEDGTPRSLTDREIIEVTEWLKERML